ncbi:hypothetical protein ECDEC14A_0557 [Escherichia coli DEC14A]|nr:hypothetical protein ECDEC14A_0557 [Escherichia coli DEC14A]
MKNYVSGYLFASFFTQHTPSQQFELNVVKLITSLPFEKYVIGQNSSPLNGLKLVIMSQFNCCDSD